MNFRAAQPLLAAVSLLIVACGRYADSAATPPLLSGVHADSIAMGTGSLCLSSGGKASCLELGGSPTLTSEPTLDGSIFITGQDGCGLLPDGLVHCALIGTAAVGGLSRADAKAVSVAMSSTMLFYVDADGALHADTGTTTTDIALDAASAVQVSASDEDVCVVLADGTVRCWSYSISYAIDSDAKSFALGDSLTPSGLSGVTQLVMYGFAENGTTACAVAGGQVLCWGANGQGQCGTGSTGEDVTTPVRVTDPSGTPLHSVASIDLSAGHGCAVIQNGDLDCWGTDVTATGPHAALGLMKNVKQVSLGAWGTDAALATDGTVLTWGGTHQVGPDVSVGVPIPFDG